MVKVPNNSKMQFQGSGWVMHVSDAVYFTHTHYGVLTKSENTFLVWILESTALMMRKK